MNRAWGEFDPGPAGLTISSVLINNGKLDFETGAGPLYLSDVSGASILNGTLGMNDGPFATLTPHFSMAA